MILNDGLIAPLVLRYLAVSPNEEHLLCSLENNQLYTLLLSNSEIMKPDEMNFDVMGTHNHQGPITGMDVAIRKPLIVTVSTDKSVRLWNYVDRTCELTKFFADEIYSVAIHPTGLQVGQAILVDQVDTPEDPAKYPLTCNAFISFRSWLVSLTSCG